MSTPASKPKSTSRWGSLLQGAVAGLESRLDTILTDDSEASAKVRTAEEVARQARTTQAAKAGGGLSRTSSQSRANARLQDRLAKAMAKSGERAGSAPAASSTSQPLAASLADNVARTSIDSRRSESFSEPRPSLSEKEAPQAPAPAQKNEINDSTATEPPQPVPASTPSSSLPKGEPGPSPRPSEDSAGPCTSADALPQSSIVPIPDDLPTLTREPSSYEAEIAAIRKEFDETSTQQKDELHAHLERIDALQAKLQYLTKSAAEKSRQAEPRAGDLERLVAEKEDMIAQLMEEGNKLSKTELKHLSSIKTLRAKRVEDEKNIQSLKQKLERAERSLIETQDRARRAEGAEKAAVERLKQLPPLEKEVGALKVEREATRVTIQELERQLTEAADRADQTEARAKAQASEGDKRRLADLRDELENARIEKKLSEDRAKTEIRDLKEELNRERERARLLEVELKGEITTLEGKLEVLRVKAEEVSSGAATDSQAKLLRQVETLQTQYSLASENWQVLEGTLTSRVTALEKERDDVMKRESDIRRKAREVNSRSRRLENEFEAVNEKAQNLESDLQGQRAQVHKLQARLNQAETALSSAHAEFERERKGWEAEMQQKIEEEKTKWRLEAPTPSIADSHLLRAESPTTISTNRKVFSSDLFGIHSRRNIGRSTSSELPLQIPVTSADHPPSRRTSALSLLSPGAPTPQRQDSSPALSQLNGNSISQTPSTYTVDPEEAFDNHSSPHRTINDMISVSTVGAGPSVQLVERMSAAVRRLESEKAASKEEMTRLLAQRDEARNEVVALMREAEEKKTLEGRVEKLDAQLASLNAIHQTTLDMLGEKCERVEELTNDVLDLKKIYRDLVESTLR